MDMEQLPEEVRKMYVDSFKEQILSQSLTGGNKTPDANSEGGGNYWTKENWDSFCQRIKVKLVKLGADADELDRLIEQATPNVIFY